MINFKTILRPFALAAGLGAAVGLAGPATTASAQDAPTAERGERGRRGHARGNHGHRGRRGMMRRAFAQLDLTDAQRAQIRTIRQTARAEGRALRASNDRAALRGHRQAVRAEIRSVLTPAQVERLGEMMQQRAANRVNRRVTRMTERLELSPTQAQQLTGILRGASSQRRAIREAGRVDGEPNREAMRALRTNTHAQIRSILTPTQAATLDEMRENRAERRANRGERVGRRGR